MKYTAVIEVDDEDLYEIIKPEIKSRNRTTEEITKTKGKTKITMISDDSIALRASLNSITKLCTVYEKMKGI